MIPYGKQSIEEDDIKAVIDVLRSDYVTTGPRVAEFENAMKKFTGAEYAVAVSSGTAALHCIMFALDIKPGDEVIVPCMTFAASSNSVLYQGGIPVFADVYPDSLLISPASVKSLITKRTKAILAVDYAGQPCDYDELRKIADEHNLYLISDACHSLGAEYKGKKVGTLSDMTALSFHPVKQITTGEGGMVLTDNKEFADKMFQFRTHGITTDYHQREKMNAWFYEMTELGYNYRITDFQCALGASQLKKLEKWVIRRQEIAEYYDKVFASMSDALVPLKTSSDVKHSYHLYVLRIKNGKRDLLFQHLREKEIIVNVHYIPVHMHPYYRKIYGPLDGLCPDAENIYKEIISIPMYPELKQKDLDFIVESIYKFLFSK
jgi:perosamine synthetase